MKYKYRLRQNHNVKMAYPQNNRFLFKRYDSKLKTLDQINVSQTTISIIKPITPCAESGCVLNRTATNTMVHGRISLGK